MSFLDDVMSFEQTAAGIIKTAKDTVDGFNQSGTDPRAPSVIQANDAATKSNTLMWVGIGLGAAVLLIFILRKKG